MGFWDWAAINDMGQILSAPFSILVLIIISVFLLVISIQVMRGGKLKLGPFEWSGALITNCVLCRNSHIFGTLFTQYQLESDAIHDSHIEVFQEINRIEYRERMLEQMQRIEKQLELYKTRLLDSYMKLIRTHHGMNVNVFEIAEFRCFNSIVDLAFYEVKSRIRTTINMNHLIEMNEEQTKNWKQELVDACIGEGSRLFAMYYPSEFSQPSPEELLNLLDKHRIEFRELLTTALDQVLFLAHGFEYKIKTLRNDFYLKKEKFYKKWESNFSNFVSVLEESK